MRAPLIAMPPQAVLAARAAAQKAAAAEERRQARAERAVAAMTTRDRQLAQLDHLLDQLAPCGGGGCPVAIEGWRVKASERDEFARRSAAAYALHRRMGITSDLASRITYVVAVAGVIETRRRRREGYRPRLMHYSIDRIWPQLYIALQLTAEGRRVTECSAV